MTAAAKQGAGVALPQFVRVSKAARLMGVPADRLRRMADSQTFARRHLFEDVDYFDVEELLTALRRLPGDPKSLRLQDEFVRWQASQRPIRRRRAAGQEN